MASKGMPKKPKGDRIAAPALHPYQMVRLRECMRNKARLRELGLPCDEYDRVLIEGVAGHSDKNRSEDVHSNKYQSGDSESEYDPLQDDNGEGDLIDDDNAKCSKQKTRKQTNNQTTSIAPGGFKFQSRKRVFADQTSTRDTRSKKNIVQQDASLPPSDICVPPPSRANESHTGELVGNLDDHTQAAIEGDISALLDNSHMTSRADAIDQPNQHSRMNNRDGFAQHDDNTLVADIADGITQHGDHNQNTNEGGEERRHRGHNMGHGLQRLNRARRGKLQVVITEGNIRPVVPLVAAKFASECNIIVRNHVPILPHWKLYKKEPTSSSKEKDPKENDPKQKEPASAYVDLFLGKLKAKFDINTEDKVVKKACIEMMKSAVRQQRYRLKQEYFDPFPLYLDNDEELNEFDLFKELHYSRKKKCYTPIVQEAITRMENKLSTTTEGAAQVVANVLAENTKKNQFLKNVGFQNVRPRSSEESTETELEVEKRANAELRTQVADLSNKVQESEQARIMDREEMKWTQCEMEAKLNLLLSQIRPS